MLYKFDPALERFLVRKKLFFIPQEARKKLGKITADCEKSFTKDGEKTIPMLKSRIATFLDDNRETDKIIIDAGGTNFRIMLVQKKGNDFIVKDFKNHPMPGSDNEISKEVFFEKNSYFHSFLFR